MNFIVIILISLCLSYSITVPTFAAVESDLIDSKGSEKIVSRGRGREDEPAFTSSFSDNKGAIVTLTSSVSSYENDHAGLLALINAFGNWMGSGIDLSGDHCSWDWRIQCSDRIVNYLNLWGLGLQGKI